MSGLQGKQGRVSFYRACISFRVLAWSWRCDGSLRSGSPILGPIGPIRTTSCTIRNPIRGPTRDLSLGPILGIILRLILGPIGPISRYPWQWDFLKKILT